MSLSRAENSAPYRPREDHRRVPRRLSPEAQRLAADVHVKLVGPLDGLREPDLMGAHVALVLGR